MVRQKPSSVTSGHKRKAQWQSVDAEVSKLSAENATLRKRKLDAEGAAAGGMSERERQDIGKKVRMPAHRAEDTPH